MKKVGQFLLSVILGGFILLFTWIIINSIFIGQPALFSYNPIILIVFMIIDTLVLIYTYIKIIPVIVKYKWLPLVLIILFTIICIIVSYSLRQNPSWDMGRVFNIAVEYNQNGHITDTYLYEYQNNIAITCIYILILKIFSIINFTDYITAITFVNAIVVSLSVVFLYNAIKKLYGKEKAIMTLIICLFTTPFYLHAAIYYTDTMSMFFCTLFLLIYTIMKEEKTIFKKNLEQVLLGLIFVIGAVIKITTTFLLIAVILTLLLNKKFKDITRDFKIFLPSIIIFFTVYTLFVNIKVIPDKNKLNNYKVPISHWIWIGSVGNGGFNQEAYEYTYSFSTYEEKNKADIEKIKETLKSYNPMSFINHINEKLKFTWSDGTYLAPEKLRRDPVNKGKLYQYVAIDGQMKDYYKYLPQTMHMVMLIFMLINAIELFKSKKYEKIDTVFIVSILGMAVFLMLCENRSRYILTLIPIMLLLEVNGIEIVGKKLKK